MTEDDIKLIQDSWALIVPDADTAMQVFYGCLFKLDSNVAQHFSQTDMAVQRSNLAAALDHVVKGLAQPDDLVVVLYDLGARHAGYGVDEAQFPLVGQALLSTLEIGLVGVWSDAHERAWTAAWNFVAAHFLDGFRSRCAA